MVTSVPEIVQHPRHADDEFVVVPQRTKYGEWIRFRRRVPENGEGTGRNGFNHLIYSNAMDCPCFDGLYNPFMDIFLVDLGMAYSCFTDIELCLEILGS